VGFRPLYLPAARAAAIPSLCRSNISDVVDWDHETGHPQLSDPGVDDRHSGKITKVIRPRVLVIDKSKIDPRVRRAIAKLVMTDNGGLRVEMHDKIAALDKLARVLGMYQDKLDVTGKHQPVVPVIIYEGRPTTRRRPAEAARAVDGDGGQGG
jgi:hypothetical protein